MNKLLLGIWVFTVLRFTLPFRLPNAKSPSGFIAEALETDGELDVQMPHSTPVEGSLSNKVRGKWCITVFQLF